MTWSYKQNWKNKWRFYKQKSWNDRQAINKGVNNKVYKQSKSVTKWKVVSQEHQYTSPPVYQRVKSIPVHLYTSHTSKRQCTSPPVHQSLKKRVYQSTCIPVTKSLENTSHCRHHATTVDVYALWVDAPSSRCLWIVAPSSRCLWFVAPSSRYHRGPHSSHLPGVKLGPKDHLHTVWWKCQASRTSSHILGDW